MQYVGPIKLTIPTDPEGLGRRIAADVIDAFARLRGALGEPVTVPDIADFDARLAAARQRLRDHDRAAHWLVPGRTRLHRFLLRQLRERDADVDRANATDDQFMLAYALGCGDAASEVLHALEAGEIRP